MQFLIKIPLGDCQNWYKIQTPFIQTLFRPRLDQGASKIGLDKLRSKSMHLPWNQYHDGPAKIVHGDNGGNSVGADSGGQ